MNEQLIKTPVTVEVTKTYGGDIPTMGGGMEVGFWTEKFIIHDAAGRPIIGGLEDEAMVRAIAQALNDHTALLAVAAAAERYAQAVRDDAKEEVIWPIYKELEAALSEWRNKGANNR